MTRIRVEPLFLTLLLVLVARVCLARGIGLVEEPYRLDAHEERQWFAWAHPRSDTAALFARAAAGLVPGEVICLEVPWRSKDWFLFMARYYLPDETVAAVRARGARRGLPSQATVLEINGLGEVRVRRGDGDGPIG